MQKRFNPLKPHAPAQKPKPEPLKKGTIPNPLPVGPAPILTENEEGGGLELRFPQRPSLAVLDFFHNTKDLPDAQRWHFHFKGKYWYASRNDATRKFAAMLIAHVSEKATNSDPASQSAKPAFVPTVVPAPLEAQWQSQTERGLTRLPYDIWLEKFLEAAENTHPQKSEKSPPIVPVTLTVVPPPWKRRILHRAPQPK